MEKKHSKYSININKKIMISCIIIFILTGFVCFFSYINEPIGDDILCYYDKFISYYLDGQDAVLGDRYISVAQVFSSVGYIYMHWSGRLTGYSFELLGKLLPKLLQAFITSLLYSGIVLLAMRILYKNWIEVLKKPFVFLVLFLALYWYRGETYYAYMWTMVGIYSVCTFLCLLYYNITVVDDENGIHHNKIIILLVGLITGMTHEVIVLCVGIAIVISLVQDIYKKRKKWVNIFDHTGLGIGYLICVFSPGNFERLHQSSTVRRFTYIKRLEDSLAVHKNVIFGNTGGIIIALNIVLLTIILICIAYKNTHKDKKDIILNSLYKIIIYIITLFFSVILWAVFPDIPTYAMEYVVIFFYLILFSLISDALTFLSIEQSNVFLGFLAMGVIIILSIVHFNEIRSYYSISTERRIRIAEVQSAEQKGKCVDFVVVPKYPDMLDSDRYNLGYLNNQYQYDQYYYKAYYNVRVVIEE